MKIFTTARSSPAAASAALSPSQDAANAVGISAMARLTNGVHKRLASREKNANVILIEKGCTPISFQGNREIPAENENHSVQPCFADPGTNYGKCALDENIEKQIIRMLRQTEMTLQDLKTILNIGWSDTRTRRFLNGLEGIKINKKGKAHLYTLIDQTEPKLF